MIRVKRRRLDSNRCKIVTVIQLELLSSRFSFTLLFNRDNRCTTPRSLNYCSLLSLVYLWYVHVSCRILVVGNSTSKNGQFSISSRTKKDKILQHERSTFKSISQETTKAIYPKRGAMVEKDDDDTMMKKGGSR